MKRMGMRNGQCKIPRRHEVYMRKVIDQSVWLTLNEIIIYCIFI